MRFTLLFIACLFAVSASYGQQFVFPDSLGLKSIPEGKELAFKLSLTDASIHPIYSLEGANGLGIQLDTLGNFHWKPSYDLVDRLQKEKEFSVIFQADWKDGKKLRKPVTFKVYHVNRPPEIEDLPVFYVRQNVQNKYQIPGEYVRDPDCLPGHLREVSLTV